MRALRRLAALACLALAGCGGYVERPQVSADGGASPEQSWAQVLRERVDDRGRVDFRGLAQQPQPLYRYVDYVYRTSWESLPSREAKLAYLLNAYNALAMYGIIKDGIPESLAGLKKVGFFYFTDYEVGGKRISLYDLENEVIRPMGEEKVHFALNCMVRGCPRLPRVPFDAATVDRQLEAEARLFFSEPRNLTIDEPSRTMRLSEILKFYTEDFTPAKAPSLIAYVNKYRAATAGPIPEDYKVEFIPYDWTVNIQPTAQAAK